MLGTGSGIMAQAGQPFPFPWYLKAISDKLDKQWKPSNEYSPNTKCVVVFVIHRSGEVSQARIAKRSGDALFDEMGLRAVIYSNPLPPLPNGYQEDTLTVNMTFEGK